jgi:hypothetical protein
MAGASGKLAETERFVRNVRVRLHLIPELHRHGVDVEADPAVVLARRAAGRRLEVAPGRRGTVEDDVVILTGIPPKIVKRWDF